MRAFFDRAMDARAINPHKVNTMRNALIIITVAGCLAVLGGCAVGPDYARPALAVPAQYTSESPPSAAMAGGDVVSGPEQTFAAGQDIPAQWWQLFHSAGLNALIASSLQHNPNLDAAQATMRGALETLYAQQGTVYPTLDASYSPSRQKVSGALASGAASGASYYNLHTAQVSVSYAPDLFGANRRQVESLKAQAESQRYQMEATRLTLTSNVVNAAIQEAALRGQIQASGAIVASQTRLLDIFRRQLELGQVAAADVAAQEAAQAGLPALEKQLSIQRNLLIALAGRRLEYHVRSGRFAIAGQPALDPAIAPGRAPPRRARSRGTVARGQRGRRRGHRQPLAEHHARGEQLRLGGRFARRPV